jgi:hypothetical protein
MADIKFVSALSKEFWLFDVPDEAPVVDAEDSSEKSELDCRLEISMNCIPFNGISQSSALMRAMARLLSYPSRCNSYAT